MANDLVNPQGTGVAVQQKNAYEAFGESVSQKFVGNLLRFTKFGSFKAGQNEEEVPLGTQLMLDMGSLKTGWVKWLDNKPADTRMGYVKDFFQSPTREELGDDDQSQWETFEDNRAKDPWQETTQIVCFDPSTGEIYTLVASSKSGRSALGEVVTAFGRHVRQRPNDLPIVELGMRKYDHRIYGEQRVPTYKIVAWSEPSPDFAAAIADQSSGSIDETGESDIGYDSSNDHDHEAQEAQASARAQTNGNKPQPARLGAKPSAVPNKAPAKGTSNVKPAPRQQVIPPKRQQPVRSGKGARF